jgi:hypothetical protein
MGIFFIATQDNWDRVDMALQTWRIKHTDAHGKDLPDAVLYERDANGRTLARRNFDEMEAEIQDALKPLRIDADVVWEQIVKLCMTNNADRARKLVRKARSDRQLRWGWALLLGIVLLPLRLGYAAVKMVLPR